MGRVCIFTIPIPPSVNALYATNWKTKRRFKSKKYDEWNTLVALYKGNTRGFKTENEVSVIYAIGKPDNRRRDVCNCEKALSDLLVNWEVLKDDCQIVDMRIYWAGDVEKGCAKITITELPQ